MSFKDFSAAIQQRFAEMVKDGALFRTDADPDVLWWVYLASFPKGTDPVFRTRTEHDCSCCRHFIRTIGNVVSVRDGQLRSIWKLDEYDGLPQEYRAVARALALRMRSAKIVKPFYHYERTVGTAHNFQALVDGGQLRFDHFHVSLPAFAVVSKANIGTKEGAVRSDFDVALRGLTEIADSAVGTVLELIADGALYRGEEHRTAVEKFAQAKRTFAAAGGNPNMVWEMNAKDPYAGRIRNTAIGTLLVDLSEGVPLEDAVKSFEAKVAPTNYKRPKPLVTEGMLKAARETVEALGLAPALERRFATLRDVAVGDVLFADRGARKVMRSGTVLDALEPTQPMDSRALAKVEAVPVAEFLENVLPRAETLEVLVESRHAPNFVSLLAPVDASAPRLFKWDNGFSWSYAGEVADSIRERVKAAGGRVEGALCCRLAWNSTDDLDLHMREPGGEHIYYHNRCSTSGGALDVDANGIDGIREDPAENIVYSDTSRMASGKYVLSVHQYNKRNAHGGGFEVEVECRDRVFRMSGPELGGGQVAQVATIGYDRTLDAFTVVPHLSTAEPQAREVWGLQTQQFHRVSAVMLSPNHWGDQRVGNRHFVFALPGARNDGKARGFYNEFLRADLEQHRRVFELLGSRIKVEDDPEQISGLGFSSTQENSLVCRVKGSYSRTMKIVF